MPGRNNNKEFKAFCTAKLNTKPHMRLEALGLVKRRSLLIRLVLETEFPDTRLGAMRKLDALDQRKAKPEEHAFYVRLAMNEQMTEIRLIASKRVHPAERDKLASSAFADVRLMVAMMTSSRDTLLRLIIDPDQAVRNAAEKGLKNKVYKKPTGRSRSTEQRTPPC